jgi:hypothetical protein
MLYTNEGIHANFFDNFLLHLGKFHDKVPFKVLFLKSPSLSTFKPSAFPKDAVFYITNPDWEGKRDLSGVIIRNIDSGKETSRFLY